MAIEKIHRGIYRITVPFDTTGTVFLYALRGDRIALVDTGVADSPKTVLQQALSEIDLSLADVSAVLNTHAHLDHIGGNLQAKRASNARIHVHSADLPMAQSVEAEVEFHTRPLRILEFPPEAIQERAAHVRKNAGESAGGGCRAVRWRRYRLGGRGEASRDPLSRPHAGSRRVLVGGGGCPPDGRRRPGVRVSAGRLSPLS